MGIAQIMAIDEEDIPNEDKVSSKTVNGLLKVCQSFLVASLQMKKRFTKYPQQQRLTGHPNLHRYSQCCLCGSITFKFAFLTVLVFMG